MTQFIGLLCFIMVGWIKVNAFSLCQCSDYGTQLGCNLQLKDNCYWENGQCLKASSNCGQFNSSSTCFAPSCIWDTTNTSQPVCSTFTTCAKINSTKGIPRGCKAFGCVPSKNGPYCADFKNCQSLHSSEDCFGSSTGPAIGRGLCFWTVSDSSCQSISQCAGTKQEICAQLPYCMQKISSNNVTTCADISCVGTNQTSCTDYGAFCQWKLNNATGNSSCITNLCKQYGNQIACDTIANGGYCAFDGKECQQCYNAGAQRISITFLISLIFAYLTL